VLSPEANARYEAMIADLEADKLAGRVEEFSSVDGFMKDL
jgi:hypothetical protein